VGKHIQVEQRHKRLKQAFAKANKNVEDATIDKNSDLQEFEQEWSHMKVIYLWS